MLNTCCNSKLQAKLKLLVAGFMRSDRDAVRSEGCPEARCRGWFVVCKIGSAPLRFDFAGRGRRGRLTPTVLEPDRERSDSHTAGALFRSLTAVPLS